MHGLESIGVVQNPQGDEDDVEEFSLVYPHSEDVLEWAGNVTGVCFRRIMHQSNPFRGLDLFGTEVAWQKRRQALGHMYRVLGYGVEA